MQLRPSSQSTSPISMGDQFAEEFVFRNEVEEEGVNSRQRVLDEIRALGLIDRAWELDVDGYTVLDPEQVGAEGLTDELREAALSVAERRLGHAVDMENGGDQSAMTSPFGQVQTEFGILGEDAAFERALMNRGALALVSYLLGESCVLIHQSVFLKGPGPDHLPLHTDQDQASGPAPFPAYAQVANATWALTDYSLENGPICFAPGSHRLCRPPTREEATDLALFKPLTMDAGSVVIWHGNTWHGALRRTAPGLRLSLVEFFGRWYQVMSDLAISQEVIERNPPRFRALVAPKLRDIDKLGAVKVQAAKETLYG